MPKQKNIIKEDDSSDENNKTSSEENDDDASQTNDNITKSDNIDENFKAIAIKFVKYDDMILEMKHKKKELTLKVDEEIKAATTNKKDVEKLLVKYFDKINSSKIQMDEDDILEKKEKIKRKPINAEMLKKVLQDELVKRKLLNPKSKNIVEEITKEIDTQRIISKEDVICRKSKKGKKSRND